jgi:hypothetical protein
MAHASEGVKKQAILRKGAKTRRLKMKLCSLCVLRGFAPLREML